MKHGTEGMKATCRLCGKEVDYGKEWRLIFFRHYKEMGGYFVCCEDCSNDLYDELARRADAIANAKNCTGNDVATDDVAASA